MINAATNYLKCQPRILKMASANSFLIKDSIIFTGEEFIENSFALVQNGRIVSVQSLDDIDKLPSDVQVISKPGHTLIPGLIDAHVHGLEGNVQCLEQSLRFGVTTVCDMHNDKRSLTKLIGLAGDIGERSKYADFKCAGAGATIENGWPAAVMKLEYKDQPEIV
jgi:dihydroorotase-like cyclic amidohydrolase